MEIFIHEGNSNLVLPKLKLNLQFQWQPPHSQSRLFVFVSTIAAMDRCMKIWRWIFYKGVAVGQWKWTLRERWKSYQKLQKMKREEDYGGDCGICFGWQQASGGGSVQNNQLLHENRYWKWKGMKRRVRGKSHHVNNRRRWICWKDHFRCPKHIGKRKCGVSRILERVTLEVQGIKYQ